MMIGYLQSQWQTEVIEWSIPSISGIMHLDYHYFFI